jgi:hypothetical protein
LCAFATLSRPQLNQTPFHWRAGGAWVKHSIAITVAAAAVLQSVMLPTAAAQSDSRPTSIGFAVMRQCQAGACPPASAQPTGTTVDLPLDFTYTMPSGDRFHVSGTYESRTERCPGPNASMSQFVVEYVGNTGDEPSQDDDIGFDTYTTFACRSATVRPGSFVLFGRFSPDIAPTSTVSGLENMNGKIVTAFTNMAPPGIFSQSRLPFTDSVTVTDALAIRETVTAHFGAGSLVGSYIAFGGQPAPGVAAPTLAMPLPSSALVAAGDSTLYLVVGHDRWTFKPALLFSTQAQQILAKPNGQLAGEIPASLLVEQPPSNVLMLYRAPDSTLYLQQFDNAWTLVPSPMNDDDLAAYDMVGSLDGVVPTDVLMLETPG